MLKIGLFGAGRIGRMHAEIIAETPGAALVCVHDVVPDAAKAVAEGVEAAGADGSVRSGIRCCP